MFQLIFLNFNDYLIVFKLVILKFDACILFRWKMRKIERYRFWIKNFLYPCLKLFSYFLLCIPRFNFFLCVCFSYDNFFFFILVYYWYISFMILSYKGRKKYLFKSYYIIFLFNIHSMYISLPYKSSPYNWSINGL